MRISDWSSDVCSSDLLRKLITCPSREAMPAAMPIKGSGVPRQNSGGAAPVPCLPRGQASLADRTYGLLRSEERRVGKECVVRVDLGGRRIIKKNKISNKLKYMVIKILQNNHRK